MAGVWTHDDVAFLRRSYATKTIAYMAARLPHDNDTIEAKAKDLALSKDKRRFAGQKMPRWSAADVAKLVGWYPSRANLEIARALNRSVKSVVSKAHGMRLRKSGERLQEMGRTNVQLRRDREKA